MGAGSVTPHRPTAAASETHKPPAPAAAKKPSAGSGSGTPVVHSRWERIDAEAAKAAGTEIAAGEAWKNGGDAKARAIYGRKATESANATHGLACKMRASGIPANEIADHFRAMDDGNTQEAHYANSVVGYVIKNERTKQLKACNVSKPSGPETKRQWAMLGQAAENADNADYRARQSYRFPSTTESEASERGSSEANRALKSAIRASPFSAGAIRGHFRHRPGREMVERILQSPAFEDETKPSEPSWNVQAAKAAADGLSAWRIAESQLPRIRQNIDSNLKHELEVIDSDHGSNDARADATQDANDRVQRANDHVTQLHQRYLHAIRDGSAQQRHALGLGAKLRTDHAQTRLDLAKRLLSVYESVPFNDRQLADARGAVAMAQAEAELTGQVYRDALVDGMSPDPQDL
jgi:hypothetical protein